MPRDAGPPGLEALCALVRPDLWDVYLDDHRAGAAAGLALARRLEHDDGQLPGFAELSALRRDVESDVDRLDELRRRLGVRGGSTKRIIALVGERIDRVRPNGRLFERTPLDRVLDLEELSMGVVGKRRLWAGLIAASGSSRLAGIDLDGLIGRADDQLRRLGVLHERAAAALADPSPDAR